MKFPVFFLVCLVFPLLSNAFELHGKSQFELKQLVMQSTVVGHHFAQVKIGAMYTTAPFPASPTYVAGIGYENPTCTGDVQGAFSYLANVCFTNGTTSQIYTCSKYINYSGNIFLILNFFPFL
jgi:hypothetical protein